MKHIFSFIIAAGLLTIATTGHAQVYVSAHVGFGVPAPRVYVAPAPAVVYQGGYAPAPVCAEPYPYPDAAYYTYPAWHGHYRDRFYYEHYRPCFEREHRERFDRRYERHNDYGHRW